jgi:hypothetical protein
VPAATSKAIATARVRSLVLVENSIRRPSRNEPRSSQNGLPPAARRQQFQRCAKAYQQQFAADLRRQRSRGPAPALPIGCGPQDDAQRRHQPPIRANGSRTFSHRITTLPRGSGGIFEVIGRFSVPFRPSREGYRVPSTARKSAPFLAFLLAHPARFELTTSAFGGQSTRLSLGFRMIARIDNSQT